MKKAAGLRVFITGGSSGIGAALAEEFARRGARVVIASRHRQRLAEVCQRVQREGGECQAVVGDVTKDASLATAVVQALERLGGLDVLVANAGFGVVGTVEELTLEDFRRQFETNVFGVLRTVKAALPAMQQSGGIVAIMGSVSGYLAVPGTAPYSMSKFAVRALAECLRGEVAPWGVSVVLLSPGFVESNIRRVDNDGVLHPEATDPVPPWLVMPSAKAARLMAEAILSRKAELVVTLHGKAAVWLARHFPRLTRWLASHGRGRKPPTPAGR